MGKIWITAVILNVIAVVMNIMVQNYFFIILNGAILIYLIRNKNKNRT
jgi:hypothetical protein